VDQVEMQPTSCFFCAVCYPGLDAGSTSLTAEIDATIGLEMCRAKPSTLAVWSEATVGFGNVPGEAEHALSPAAVRASKQLPGLSRLAVWSEATETLEARVGIEPTHKGFADLSLTTWVPRPDYQRTSLKQCKPLAARGLKGDLQLYGAGDGI
jgi:hypothetical protein